MSFFSRTKGDKVAGGFMLAITLFLVAILLGVLGGLIWKSLPVLQDHPISEILLSDKWFPLRGQFGMLPFLVGTLWVTIISVVIAVPVCLLTAIYLSEYAPKRVTTFITPFIDILSGIPSVIFGVWGIILIVPLIRNQIAPFFGYESNGYSILAGGLVLAVMIIPIIINVLLEVFRAVPIELREASLSLGATKWETVKSVLLRRTRAGIIASVVLGLSRALGETMAVLMVVGNVVHVPGGLFEPGYPLPALIANNYGEMLSIPLYDSALMLAALVLLLVVIAFNVFSRIVLTRIERNLRYE
ncbi:MAG: phosphate ABC transporter permease subunit PstC [Bacteroidota bacterium]